MNYSRYAIYKPVNETPNIRTEQGTPKLIAQQMLQ